MHNTYIIWSFWLSLLLVCFGCSMGSNVTDELTEKYGAEFQSVYENHVKAQIVALDTGDTSLLEETSTGWELKNLKEIANSKTAHTVLEGRKVDIIELRVSEYSLPTATIHVYQKVLGNIPKRSPRYRSSVCELQKEEGKWKVVRCRAPEFK